MLLRESFRLALDTLRSHKLRSFLTLLGVIISVCTLIAVVSVIDGMDLYIADHLANLGSNVFSVNRFGIINNLKDWVAAQKRKRIFIEDMEWARDNLRLAKAVGGVSGHLDRKSTRLNSSHLGISYAVFCLKKKIDHSSSSPGCTCSTPPPGSRRALGQRKTQWSCFFF